MTPSPILHCPQVIEEDEADAESEDGEAEEVEPTKKKVENDDLRGAETTVLSLVSQREAALADFKVTVLYLYPYIYS